MTAEYELSVCVITMNRAEQLKEALESCVACKLPEKTEFVVLDNASTDDTELKVEEFKNAHPDIPFRCFFSEKNLGVGGGRSFVFDKADGEILYFLDDDAVISPDSYETFFVENVRYMKENPSVASVTTQIYDELKGYSRTELMSNKIFAGKRKAFFYLGGSHFLRKSCFDSPLYFDIQYGSEEYAPSIKAIDKGFVHVFDESSTIIHKPKVNKWVDNSDTMRKIQIRCAATVYATKLVLYPAVFKPILFLGYKTRCKKYLTAYPGAQKESDDMVAEIVKNNREPKVKIKTVIGMFKDFGMTVF